MRTALRAVLGIALLLGVTLPMAAAADTNTLKVRTGVFPFYAYAKKYDMWKFTPMDQGGRLIQLQLVGSERDVDFVKAIRTPGFFKPWGDPIRWDSLEKTEPEKSVWLNRWYFLPCLARQYYLTGDKTNLQEILTFLRKWTAENPVPSDLTAYFATRQENWHDMQVAWRMQNLAWVYFLGEKGFTTAEKRELYGIVEAHARVLLEFFGKMPLNENNHQSHGASAMLYAALLFPDLPEAAALKERAFVILNHHLDQAFYDDGNSVELVPGYYPFFSSIFRDVFLLCRANHVAPPPRCEERLQQIYQYLHTVAQPDGLMPPINDSTESDPSVCTHVLAKLFHQSDSTPTSHWFSASDQAVMRDTSSATPAYVFLDAGSRILAHWHGGKLGFHLWFWDQAFVVDSGVSDYDDPLKKSWYAQPEAHNVVLVDGKGDYTPYNRTQPKRTNAGSHIIQWESNARYDWAVMQHDGFQDRSAPVSWVRHFILLKGVGALLVEQLGSASGHEYTWLFHLLPCPPAIDDKSGAVFTGLAEKNLLLLPAASQYLSPPAVTNGTINRQGRNLSAPVVSYTAHTTNIFQAYLLLPVAGKAAPVTQLTQTVDGDTVTLNLTGPFGAKRLTIRRTAPTGTNQYTLDLETPSTTTALTTPIAPN